MSSLLLLFTFNTDLYNLFIKFPNEPMGFVSFKHFTDAFFNHQFTNFYRFLMLSFSTIRGSKVQLRLVNLKTGSFFYLVLLQNPLHLLAHGSNIGRSELSLLLRTAQNEFHMLKLENLLEWLLVLVFIQIQNSCFVFQQHLRFHCISWGWFI